MRDNRGIDRDIASVPRQSRAVWDAINALRSERRAAATTIGSGGFTVDGGDVVMLDDDGSEIFRLGAQIFGDRGLTITRENGAIAFEMRKAFSNSSEQSVYVRDYTGEVLLAEEPFGGGLEKPYLPIPLQPVSATPTALNIGPWGPQVAVTSGSFTTTHQAWWARHNRFGLFRVRVAASDTTTAGEVQIIDATTGVPLTAFFQPPWLGVRPAGSTGYTEIFSPSGLVLPGATHSAVSVAVQVRRTAGAGTLTVAVPESRGGQV